jgi:hypothetical protein
MSNRVWWIVIAALGVVIVVLAWLLISLPAPERPRTSPPTATSTEPLHARIVVSSPQPGAAVGTTFTVSGEVPGNWSFEAQFPVQVRDKDNSKIGQTAARLKGNWMTTELVPFVAVVTVSNYTGPATLVLLRDNPSELPENNDSLEIPIVVQ